MARCMATSMRTGYLANRMHDFLRMNMRHPSDFLPGTDDVPPDYDPVLGYYLDGDEGRTKVGFNHAENSTWVAFVCAWMAVMAGREQYFRQREDTYLSVRINGYRSVLIVVDPEWNDPPDNRRPRITKVDEVGYTPPAPILSNYRNYGLLTTEDVDKRLRECHHYRHSRPPSVDFDQSSMLREYYDALRSHRAISEREDAYRAELHRMTELWEDYL